MSFTPNQPPDPTGSPNEKINLSRRSPSPFNLARFLRAEGLPPDLSERIGRAVQQWENEMRFGELETIIDLEMWANAHSHPGGSGGGSIGTGPGGVDTWTQRANSPEVWAYHAMVPLGDYMYLFGGTGAGSTGLTQASRMHVSTEVWESLTPMPTGLQRLQAVALDDGTILVMGGASGVTGGTGCYIYNPATDSWSVAPSMGTARRDFIAHKTADGKVVAAYGYTGSTAGTFTNSAEIFDGSSWSPITPPGSALGISSETVLSRVNEFEGRGLSVLAGRYFREYVGGSWATVLDLGASGVSSQEVTSPGLDAFFSMYYNTPTTRIDSDGTQTSLSSPLPSPSSGFMPTAWEADLGSYIWLIGIDNNDNLVWRYEH